MRLLFSEVSLALCFDVSIRALLARSDLGCPLRIIYSKLFLGEKDYFRHTQEATFEKHIPCLLSSLMRQDHQALNREMG